MTEMSVAEPAPAGAAGGKQDPVVPDVVVYICSFIIVVVVVGGVFFLSVLMKQRLEVNMNVTSGARLLPLDESDGSDFKILNNEDPFYKEFDTADSRQSRSRDGLHRKVPFYEAAHSKQKTRKPKKLTTKRILKKKHVMKRTTQRPTTLLKKAKRNSHKANTKRNKQAKKRAQPAQHHEPPSINMSSTDIKANDIPGNDLVYVSKGTGRSTTSKPSAIGIRGVRPGMDFRVEVVGATVKNTPASKKPASKPNKTIVFHVSAKRLPRKGQEKTREGTAESMKVVLDNLTFGPDENANLSDVSEFIASDTPDNRTVVPTAPDQTSLEGFSNSSENVPHQPLAEDDSARDMPENKFLAEPKSIEKAENIPGNQPLAEPKSLKESDVNGTVLSPAEAEAEDANSTGMLLVEASPKLGVNGTVLSPPEAPPKLGANDPVLPPPEAPPKLGVNASVLPPPEAPPKLGVNASVLPPPEAPPNLGVNASVLPPPEAPPKLDVNSTVMSPAETPAKLDLNDTVQSPLNPESPVQPGGSTAQPGRIVEPLGPKRTRQQPHEAVPRRPGHSAIPPQRPLFCQLENTVSRALASYCTHLIFGRLHLDADPSGVIKVRDPDKHVQERLRYLSVMRDEWPHMSILTTLGGTEDDDVALTKAFEGNRLDDLAKDVASAIKLNHLDGVNIYWVEPDLDGNVDRDAKGLVFLVKSLRQELGAGAVLTVVVPSEREERRAAFHLNALTPIVDFIFLSTHEVFTPYSTTTRFAGPAQDIETGGMFTAISDTLHDLDKRDTRRLCFTVGLAGVAYHVDPDIKLAKYLPLMEGPKPASGVYQNSAHLQPKLSRDGRLVPFDEVCRLNLTCHRAFVEKSCYDKRGDVWYGYVDETAVSSKVKWLLKDGWENLCVVAWNVDMDDTAGDCRREAYPLLHSINQVALNVAY